jgi:hypothetical protein
MLPFTPNLGPMEHRLLSLIDALGFSKDPAAFLDEQAAVAYDAAIRYGGEHPERRLRWALSLAVLADVAAAGGRIIEVDSTLQVSWPDWTSGISADGLRSALQRLQREMNPLPPDPKALAALPPTMSFHRVTELVSFGSFNLRASSERHPSGATYGEIFSVAQRSWTMPTRDREGRNRRFVLVLEHPSLAEPTPVGILEAGDGAPLSPLRDSCLALTNESLLHWIGQAKFDRTALSAIASRLEALFYAVLPVPGVEAATPALAYEKARSLETMAAGRSGGRVLTATKKRLIYLARLCRAHEAFCRLSAGESPDTSDLQAAVRVVRDLVVPRINLELTICGGLPPFSAALVGKLMVAFAADPRVLAICGSPPGEILQSVFDVGKLASLLPSAGALLLTTKGLYSRHSAQYERSTLPGALKSHPVRLRKIGLTSGVTASMMSTRTARLALSLLEVTGQGEQVSGEYGSGGSKRQRRIEKAVRLLGLPGGFVHPHLQRPVYAAVLCNNLREVTWLNSTPDWCVALGSSDDYAERAVDQWRTDWLPTIRRRLARARTQSISGVRDYLKATR